MRQNVSKLYRLNEFLTKRNLLRNKLRKKFDDEDVSVHPDLELDIVHKPWKRRKVGCVMSPQHIGSSADLIWSQSYSNLFAGVFNLCLTFLQDFSVHSALVYYS